MMTGKSIAELEARILDNRERWEEFREAMFKVHTLLGVSTDNDFLRIAREMYMKVTRLHGRIEELEIESKDILIAGRVAQIASLQARIDAAVDENALGGISSTCFEKFIPCGTCNNCLVNKAIKILTADEPPSNAPQLTTLQQCQDCGLEPGCPPVCPHDEPQGRGGG